MPTASPPFDARPLTAPVDPGAVRDFSRQLRASGRVPAALSGAFVVIAVAVVFVFVVGLGVFVPILGSFAAMAFGDVGGFAAFGMLLPVLIFAGVLAAIVIAIVRGIGGQGERWYRLDRFAAANGMSYEPRRADPALPGMIFDLGADRESTDLVRGQHPRFVEFANYRYTTGSGKDRTTHRWGYVAIRLDVPLPHIVLDATGNNALFGSNLPAFFDKDQRLSLEGDFDRHFTLYCPTGYERDALYLFTPDIMARFIDTAAALDVEIIDDWLFLYAKRDFSTLDPATWAWLFSVVAAMLDKLAQWARWRDDALPASTPIAPASPASSALTPPPGVARPGRRLRRSIPWPAIVVVAVFAVLWLAMQAGVFGSMLGGMLP